MAVQVKLVVVIRAEENSTLEMLMVFRRNLLPLTPYFPFLQKLLMCKDRPARDLNL